MVYFPRSLLIFLTAHTYTTQTGNIVCRYCTSKMIEWNLIIKSNWNEVNENTMEVYFSFSKEVNYSHSYRKKQGARRNECFCDNYILNTCCFFQFQNLAVRYWFSICFIINSQQNHFTTIHIHANITPDDSCSTGLSSSFWCYRYPKFIYIFYYLNATNLVISQIVKETCEIPYQWTMSFRQFTKSPVKIFGSRYLITHSATPPPVWSWVFLRAMLLLARKQKPLLPSHQSLLLHIPPQSTHKVDLQSTFCCLLISLKAAATNFLSI